MRATATAFIPCGVETAFDFVADMHNDPIWAPLVESVAQISGDGPGVGARWRVMQRVGKRLVPLEFELTAFQRPALLAWRMESRHSSYRASMVFAPHRYGVRLRQVSQQTWRAPWYVRALGPFVVRRQLRRQFRLLRRALRAQDK